MSVTSEKPVAAFTCYRKYPNRCLNVDNGIIKQGQQFLFAVNGIIVQEYIDHGHQGPLLNKGRIGLRNWAKQSAYFKNFTVHRPG
jgi:Domain of unknown function (DUF1961)